MSTRRVFAAAAAVLICLSTAAAAQTAAAPVSFGTPVSPQELKDFFAIPPDGRGLPPGSGDAAAGAKVYAEQCGVCHGERLEGNAQPGIGADRLLGGRGTLASKTPVKTVESYWPYATTVFDYVKRSMPFTSPGSLTDDQVYAVVAYILSEGKIIKPDEVMNAETLPKVRMPNRDGFVPDPRPEAQLYHPPR